MSEPEFKYTMQGLKIEQDLRKMGYNTDDIVEIARAMLVNKMHGLKIEQDLRKMGYSTDDIVEIAKAMLVNNQVSLETLPHIKYEYRAVLHDVRSGAGDLPSVWFDTESEAKDAGRDGLKLYGGVNYSIELRVKPPNQDSTDSCEQDEQDNQNSDGVALNKGSSVF